MTDMTEAEFAAYIEKATAHFGDELARATDRTPEETLTLSRAKVATLLPQGRATPGHRFCNLPDGAGYLWCGQAHGALFLFDIQVKEDERGKGRGRTAMHWLEDEARRLGETRILLSMFSHNQGAIRLYERLGYKVTDTGPGGQRMAKDLE